MTNLGTWTTGRLALALAGTVLFGGSAAAFAADLRAQSAPAASYRAGVATVPVTPVPAVQPAPDQYNPTPVRPVAAVPSRIRIPRIGVDAPVETAGVTGNYEIGVPSDTGAAAWYSLGPSPGQPGDAVIDGHLDTPSGGPAVFAGLARLQPGDTIEVTLPDGARKFTVRRLATVPYRPLPEGLLDASGEARLTLITCAGAWDSGKSTYSQRLLVEAVQA